MTRTLARASIDDLEALFEKNKGDISGLRSLVNELVYRSTPRATALLDKAQRMLKVKEGVRKINDVEPSPPPTTNQDWAGPAIPHQNGFDFEVPVFAPGKASDIPSIERVTPLAPKPTALVPKAAEPTHIQISTEQAYRLLKVTPTASWETIEAARRELVSRAQPDKVASLPPDSRKTLLDEARLINLAYKQLLLARS